MPKRSTEVRDTRILKQLEKGLEPKDVVLKSTDSDDPLTIAQVYGAVFRWKHIYRHRRKTAKLREKR